MRTILKVSAFVMSIGIAAYAIISYAFLPLGSQLEPTMLQNFLTHKTGIYTHIFASSVAMLLGPLQFSTRIRSRYLDLHRWAGRIYLGVGVLIGGLSGLYMSFYAFGGIGAKLGFLSLAVCWLFTGFKALASIRQKNITAHRQWMVFNFSLTLAAATLRIYLPLSAVIGLSFEVAYPIIAWLAWIPNLFVAAWLIRLKPRARSVNSSHS